MRPFTRIAALLLSTVFCGAALVTVNRTSGSSLFSSPTGQASRPAKQDTVASTVTSAAPTPPFQVAANSHTYRDGTYTGPPVDAYYGLLQVQAQIQGGRIVSINVLQYPSDNGTSRYINSQALPFLESEVIQAQSVFVNMVSGATLSSNAFLRSTYAALRQAKA
jgi:uncharacterized protein with FMN-binding domain